MDKVQTGAVPTEYGMYRKLSVRLPEFYDRFSPEDGWGIEIEVTDPLSMRPGLLELYKECIRHGRSARSLPDPQDPSWKAVVVIAKLTKDGRVINTASTHQLIEYEKDYEMAETRARQRLVAACGFGGEILDADERINPGPGHRIVAGLQPDAEDDDVDLGDLDEPTEPSSEEEETRTGTVPEPAAESSELPAFLRAQVDARWASLGDGQQSFSYPRTKKEALRFLKETQPGTGASS